MSLKGFHIFFISASTVLAFALGAWSIVRFMDVDGVGNAALALFSVAGGVLLVVYGIRIRKKLNALGFSWDLH
jgi:hypothetical protein